MKRNFIKNILLSAFSAICAVTAVAGVAVALPTENAPAKAETAAWQTGVFEMEDGVSLKLSEANGLRFIVKMDEDVYSFVNETEGAEMGFVIAPENLMVAANGDYLNMEKQIGGAIDKNKLYQDQDGGFWYANGCIHNVMAKNITRDFVAVSYIKYGDTVRYTEYNSLARNNLYDTVNMATLGGYANEVFQLETYTGSDDPNDDNTGWYGSEVYPIVVENTTEYDALVNAVNGDVDMSNYYCVIKNNATPTYAFSNADYKPILISEALYNVRNLINGLPDSVTMPDGIGVIGRIRETEKAYGALSAAEKEQVENYAKVEGLLAAIDGYDRVYKNDATDGTVIPSYVPNYTATVGGSATTRTDELYGNVLTVTSDANGKAALSFENFPSVAKYEKIYFYAKVSQACNIYFSDGTTNDGWGADWKNNWSVDGYWCNENTWRLVEIDVSSGYVGTNFALGFRVETTGFTFEISDFYGVLKGQTQTSTSFGNIADTGTTNVYGTVYNLTQGWPSATDLGAFNIGILSGALNEGHDSLRFYIYNPNESDVVYYFMEDETWDKTEVTTLTAQAWTEVVVSPELIEANKTYLLYCCVESGASTSGWQISPIYSFSSSDVIGKVQARIDALDTENINEEAVTTAREEYEALTESEKACLTIDNLIACEKALYEDCENQEFIKGGATKYKMYIESTEAISTASAYVNEYLDCATGVTLSVETAKPTTITKYRYAIVFGHDDLWDTLNLTRPTEEELGVAGYAIKKIGRTVLIFAYGADGYRMAAFEFLRQTVGYDMISEDCVVYDGSKAETLPEFDRVTKPSFTYRQQQTYMTEAEIFGMGLQTHVDLWIPSSAGWDMHNTLHYLPAETYRSAHSAWYYDYTDSVNVARTQICPTAGGSSTEFNAMVETIAANMLVQINAYPERENISFSIMDTGDGDDCTCSRCTLYDTLYGEGGFAAAWIDLMNAVNAKVRESLPADRTLNIAFLAYRGTEKAPASIDANGNVTLPKRYEINDDGTYTQTSEDLKCDEGVTVWLAPINGLYAENVNHADNAETLATIKKWAALSDSVYLWMYGTNFKFYMYPYNTWKASAENYKILADLGVKAAWSQSNETEATAFSDLKGYIDSKFMFDVNADYETVLSTYFTNYYGAGATKMRDLFDKIVAKCEEIEANNDGLGRGIYDELENTSGFLGIGAKTYWSQTWIEECVTLCDEATAAVDADSLLSDAQKTAIKSRITKESLFPRYVLCTTFASKYSSSDRTTMRQEFKADCEALGITLYREADGELSDLYSDWGV